MTIKYKELGMTEEEIINLPKIHKGCIYIGEKDVFLKKGKNNIINLGSKELFRDIHNIFNFDTATEIHLFLALCGNEEVTSFKGDPYKTVEKLVEGVDESNRGERCEKYLKSNRELRKNYPLYSNRTIKRIMSKGCVQERISELENQHRLWHIESKKLTRYKEIVDSLNDDIIDVLSCGKYNLIKSSFDPADIEIEKGTSKYYKYLSDKLCSSVRLMHPITDNNSPFGIKVAHIRDKSSLGCSWSLESGSTVDVKTGDLKIFLSGSVNKKEISLNLYKDDISKSQHKDEISISLLLNTIMKNYSKSKIRKAVIYDIIDQTLKNDDMKWLVLGRGRGNVYNAFIRKEFYGKIYRGENSPENYLKTIVKIIRNIDKLNNVKEYELFNNNSSLIHIPNKDSWKIYEVFHLTKQTYKKLLNLNPFERKNYLDFAYILHRHYNHLYNETNLHRLFDDTFLMVQDSENVSAALRVDSVVDGVIPFSFSDYKKMVHYLDVDAQDRQRIGGYALRNYYYDYLKDLAILIKEGYRTLESVNLTPYSLKLEHDVVTDERESIQYQLDAKKLEGKYDNKLTDIINKTYKLKDGQKIKFLPGDTPQKLKEEGKSLSHCVGGYVSRIINDNCLILLARKEEDIENSWFTVEIRITDNGYVLGQQQSLKEYKLPNELKTALEKDIKKVNEKEFRGVV